MSTTAGPNEGFPYPKLGLTKKQIRLLKFLEVDQAGLLSFSLECHDLKEASFVAVSYTWERYTLDIWRPTTLNPVQQESTEHVSVAGEHFEVTRSLFEFLQNAVPTKLKGRLFFVDQICIDQRKELEKRHQVSIMGDVYAGAAEVIAWIVPLIPQEEDLSALQAMSDDDGAQRCLQGRRGLPCLMTHHSRLDESGAIFAALRLVLTSAFWSRQWIVQEVLLAKELSFQIESFNFDWEVILQYTQRVPNYVGLGKHGRDGITAMFTWLRDGNNLTPSGPERPQTTRMIAACSELLLLRHECYHKSGDYQRRPLHEALTRFGARDCGMQRDGIFSLLGLTTADMNADYSMSSAGLYLNVLRIGLTELREIRTLNDERQEDSAIFIHAALTALKLDIREPPIALITERMLSHFDMPSTMQGATTRHVWYLAILGSLDLGLNPSQTRDERVQAEKQVVIPAAYAELQNEIRSWKGSGSEKSVNNWDDLRRLPGTESRTYKWSTTSCPT
ncbi:uncharacterized protein LTR77_010657 [Saxophila tyrrhenica]|uniref:Heterokaryon incompatibility domain-containing protein n=1 Tax=Saxophila tyrrhenica TaxID=1690608 RepID=A0AAV9NUU4_9PEZI|nr:hypothetical protein LTR77_010657 [Saxophila tyrrhenica]